jgi:hypothetical protein
MKNHNFDEILDSIRNDEPSAEQVEQAASRVRQNLFGAGSADVGRITGCADYRSLFPSYLSKTISDARRMLVDDHIRECGACRKALDEAKGVRAKVVPFVAPKQKQAPMFQKWAIAAGLFAAVGSSSWGILKFLFPSSNAQVASIQNINGGMLYQGNLPVTEGREIAANESIRTPLGTRAVVKLQDGSLVEVNERSELSVSKGWSGTTIRLDRGSIIVQAAKQRNGSLMVQTNDALVSVKGTIFSVNRGTKGSRVSVVEGSVQVDQKARGTEMLKPGDQTTTDASLGKVPISEEVSWSKDAARYMALLAELNALGKKLDAIPGPGLRYSSKLLQYVPEDTQFYAAIPNIGNTIGEAKRVFDSQLKESPTLRAWWDQSTNARARAEVDEVINEVQQFASYVGDEVIIAMNGKDKRPMAMAEVKREGLAEFIRQEIAKHGGKGPEQGRHYDIHNGILIATGDEASLRQAIALVDQGGSPSSPFRQRIEQAYQSGAGWLLCANMEQIIKENVQKKQSNSTLDFGVDNVKYLVLERKDVASKTQNVASLSFSEQRKGVMAWLGSPSALSSLDFISPDAGMAVAAVTKNPRMVVEEILTLARSKGDGKVDVDLAEIETRTGVKLVDDLAASLGSEFAFASDGPVLQSLSWKVAAEMYSPQRFQNSIEKLIETFNREAKGQHTLTLKNTTLDNRTFYSITIDGFPVEIHYTYVDGYLLAGANRALLATAIKNRANGYMLARSEKFRAQLPYGSNPDFSAVFYHNVGSALGPVAEQLKTMGYGTEEFKKGLDGVKDMGPGLVAIYGEPTKITAATHGDFFGLNLGMLAGIDKGGFGMLQVLAGANGSGGIKRK